jgi:hypothetical protein
MLDSLGVVVGFGPKSEGRGSAGFVPKHVQVSGGCEQRMQKSEGPKVGGGRTRAHRQVGGLVAVSPQTLHFRHRQGKGPSEDPPQRSQ